MDYAKKIRKEIDNMGLNGHVRISYNFNWDTLAHFGLKSFSGLSVYEVPKNYFTKNTHHIAHFIRQLDSISVSQYSDHKYKNPYSVKDSGNHYRNYEKNWLRNLLITKYGFSREEAYRLPININEFGIRSRGLMLGKRTYFDYDFNVRKFNRTNEHHTIIGVLGLYNWLDGKKDKNETNVEYITHWGQNTYYDIFGIKKWANRLSRYDLLIDYNKKCQ